MTVVVPKPPMTRHLLTRNFTPANRGLGDILWVVQHDMEMPEKPDTAEACNGYFQVTPNETSAHYCVDSTGIDQGVLTGDIAWAALHTANLLGVHIEHAGYARQTTGQWLDPYGLLMLPWSAWLTAWLCDQFGLPPKRLTAADVKARRPGVVGHDTLSAAKLDGNNHSDPGSGFPWDWYMGRVEDIVTGRFDPLQEDSMTPEQVYNAVWRTDGKMKATNPTEANPYWWPENVVEKMAHRVDSTEGKVDDLAGAVDDLAAKVDSLVAPTLPTAAEVAAELIKQMGGGPQ